MCTTHPHRRRFRWRADGVLHLTAGPIFVAERFIAYAPYFANPDAAYARA